MMEISYLKLYIYIIINMSSEEKNKKIINSFYSLLKEYRKISGNGKFI